MKKITFILVLISVTVCGQSTYWQQKLDSINKRETKKNYGWFDSLSTNNKTEYLIKCKSIEINVKHEIRLNAVVDSSNAAFNDSIAFDNYINHLKSLGFRCKKGSDTATIYEKRRLDYLDTYNMHPEWFGKLQIRQNNAYVRRKDSLKEFANFCIQYGY